VKQRTRDDCMICCAAMATGLPYEVVIMQARKSRLGYEEGIGTRTPLYLMSDLGFDVKHFHTSEDDPAFPVYNPLWLWGRPAILSVPSQSGFEGWHTVYWDGRHLHDPSIKEPRYPDTLDDLTILSVCIWQAQSSTPRNEWREIESAPRDQHIVVGAWKNGEWHWTRGCFESNGYFAMVGGQWTPSHWMPLPAPPTGDPNA
jgi:hypothetical protein